MEKHREPPGDVRKSGYLRKHKSLHRRFFVLRAGSARGPARLEYYDSEKKFRGKAPVPRKALVLESVFNVNKRADAKHKHMIALYTRTESFLLAAEGETEQDEWYRALLELHCQSKVSGGGGDYGLPSPGPAFKEVWQVKVWPKGLGQARNLVGVYRLCLTERTVIFVKLHSDAAAVVLQLMNVRRCGHSENFFFVEVGRSAITGAGEFWMQVEDCVVAQNMHETLLDAMKALSEEFRQPGGGATASNPISVPSRRHHPNPPPSQVGFSRRPRTEPPVGGSPSCRHSFPEGTAAASSSPTPSDTPALRPAAAKAPPALTRSTSTPAPGSERWTGGVCPLSGSLSDCGSSDECGSSPSSLADDASNYILMAQSGTSGHALRRPSGQRASLPPAGEEAGEEGSYAVMSRTRAECHSAGHGGGAYLDVTDETLDPPAHATGASVTRDNGYMCMLPGVTAPPSDSDSRLADDYMSMIPSGSVSPPRQVGDGYMMMSPSSSVSPEQRATPSPWCGGSSTGSDYMNMSPVSARSASSSSPPPLVPAGRRPLQAPPKTLHSYYSLPRSYKHRAWACVEVVAGGLSLSSSSSSSSSTSSESVGDEQTGGVRQRRSSVKRRHSTLPRAKSPGEYVSIQPRPSPSCGDYTSMTFSLDSAPASPSATPAGPSSLSGPAEAPRPDRAARVVRAELPGRRRPCSETFRVWLGPSALADHTRRPGQEGVARLAPPVPQQGLNYIDLDLASKESSRATGDVLPAAHTSATRTPPPSSSCSSPSAAATGVSGGASNLNLYASIDFYRSEELRTQHTNTSSHISTSSTGKKEARVAVEHHEEC